MGFGFFFRPERCWGVQEKYVRREKCFKDMKNVDFYECIECWDAGLLSFWSHSVSFP